MAPFSYVVCHVVIIKNSFAIIIGPIRHSKIIGIVADNVEKNTKINSSFSGLYNCLCVMKPIDWD